MSPFWFKRGLLNLKVIKAIFTMSVLVKHNYISPPRIISPLRDSVRLIINYINSVKFLLENKANMLVI